MWSQSPYKEDILVQLCQFKNVFCQGRRSITGKTNLIWKPIDTYYEFITMFFMVEEVKETTLHFLQGRLRVW